MREGMGEERMGVGEDGRGCGRRWERVWEKMGEGMGEDGRGCGRR